MEGHGMAQRNKQKLLECHLLVTCRCPPALVYSVFMPYLLLFCTLCSFYMCAPALFFSYCQTINVKKIQVNNIFTFIAQILLFFMFGIIKFLVQNKGIL